MTTDVLYHQSEGNGLLFAFCPERLSGILKNRADVNAYDEQGYTPLMCIVSNMELSSEDKRKYVKILLDMGAEVNHRGPLGGTALMQAILSGDVPVVKQLLEAGASTKMLGQHAAAPLNLAVLAKDDNTEMIEALVEGGADVHWFSASHNPPLLDCVLMGHPKNAETLIRLGASPYQANNNGTTPMRAAWDKGNVGIKHVFMRVLQREHQAQYVRLKQFVFGLFRFGGRVRG